MAVTRMGIGRVQIERHRGLLSNGQQAPSVPDFTVSFYFQ